MARIAVTIVDAADIRAYECELPDSIEVSRIALRLAELMHLPLLGPDGRPLRYGLIPKGGSLLDPDASLSELNVPCPLTLRLIPEIAAGSDELEAPSGFDAGAHDEESEIDVIVGEPAALIHDADLGIRPDVRIDAEVHKRIEEFAAANRNRECAGLLLGTVDSEGKGRVIHISAAIPAEGAVGTRASVRIPLQAWEEMLGVRDLDYGDLRVLGWFHTHAGWGVFMSDADVFIHRHFFPHPSMVAYVLDPTTGRDGFFYWHEGKIGLCPSYGLVGPPADMKPLRGRGKPAKSHSPARSLPVLDKKNWVIAALVLVVAYFAFAGSPFARRAKSAPERAKPRVVVTKEVGPSVQSSARSAGAKPYAIRAKDNPWSICNRVYNDGDLGPALMRYNGLPSNPRLQIGQRIKMPSKDTLKKLRHR